MEHPDCQSDIEGKKKGWKYQLPRLQSILQSYSKKNSVTGTETDTCINAREQRAQNQTHTHVELIYN